MVSDSPLGGSFRKGMKMVRKQKRVNWKGFPFESIVSIVEPTRDRMVDQLMEYRLTKPVVGVLAHPCNVSKDKVR